MMLIIDRYLLRQFLQTFLICYLSLTGLYIIFDAFANLDEFVKWGEREGGLWAVMGPFYLYQSIGFFDRTVGLLTLTSAMFTVTWIQRHNEMTALMAAGISRVRVIRPVIAAVAVISLLAAVNRELVIPKLRSHLAVRPKEMAGDAGRDVPPRYDNRTNVLIRGDATFLDQQRIEAPDFLLPASLDRYGKHLKAKNAFYQPPANGRPGGYLLRNVQQPKSLETQPSLSLDGRPVLITPRDAPDWLKPGECFLASDLSFEQLTAASTWRDFSSVAELIRGLHNPSLAFEADVRVAVHSRFLQPLLDMTLLLLGLPLVLTRESRNIFLAIGLCACVTSAFVLVVTAFQYLGSISYLGISPALAAWAPAMIFVPIAVAMADAMWE
jgi:lipopolysaccharide export system permease protein